MTEAAQPNERHLTYQRRMKYCSRLSCRPCRSGTPSHGPYWYASWREGGRVRSRYLGKQAPPSYAPAPPAPEAEQISITTAAPASQQPPLRIQTFGRLAVWQGSEPVPEKYWNRKKAAALLGILLSQPDYALHREQIIDLLWPEVSIEIGQRRLWSTLRQLREALDLLHVAGSHLGWHGDRLILAPGAASNPETGWIDATAFDRIAVLALAGRDIQTCREAIETYGDAGDYLPTFLYEDWAIRRRTQLRDRLIAVLLHGATLLQQEGRADQAERYLQRILEMDPCHEGAACALMTLLRLQGRIADGLRVYSQVEMALAQLGVEPEPETRRIREQLENALRAPVAQTILPPPVDAMRRTNLPPPISSFVGRSQEQAAVGALLRSSRLVTLTGIGGVGKTRLALAVADAHVSAFKDGVWFVDLSGLPGGAASTNMLLCQAMARVLGVQESSGEPLQQALMDFLQPREVLLVLDTCEHLIHECASLAHALLVTSPRLTVLATSRELLNITGEMAWSVPPLNLPDADRIQPQDALNSEAVQLFLARAQARRPDFTLTPANAGAVTQVCRKVDGIPLSLELAAARLSMLSVEQIAARLEDRLQLLTGGSRTALPRHQALRATLDWSYALLNEPERVLLRRLAVFAGGCDLDAIEAVCTGSGIDAETVVDDVGSLVHKSLILAGMQDNQVRYWLLDTVRQYSQEHLTAWGEEEAIRERHCRWYVSLVEQARPRLRGADQRLWLNRLEMEHDNIRAALQWSINHAGAEEHGLRLAGAIWQFWYMRDYITEGRYWLERVLAGRDHELAGQEGTAALRAEALNGAGCLAFLQSDTAHAQELLEASLQQARHARDSAAQARALTNLATIAAGQGAYEQALSLHEQSLSIFRERQDRPNAAAALHNMGTIRLNLGHYEAAQPLLEEGLQIFRAIDFKLGIAKALTSLASIMRQRGDCAHARVTMEEVMTYLRESGDLSYKGEALLELGTIEEALSNYPVALSHVQEALRLAFDSQDEPGCREAMEGVSWICAVATGELALDDSTSQDTQTRRSACPLGLSAHGRAILEDAARLLAASNGQITGSQPRHPRQQAQYDARVRAICDALGHEVFERSWSAGQQLSREGALGRALDASLT